MPCKWDKEDIVVFGVRITPPYTHESCTGGDDPHALERVKKVLQGELQKMERAKHGAHLAEGAAAGGSQKDDDVEERSCQEWEELQLSGSIEVESAWFGLSNDSSCRTDISAEVRALVSSASGGEVRLKKDTAWADPAKFR